MAKVYSEYLDDSGKLKQEEPYTTTFGELPGYYGFYPNLATNNTADYIKTGLLVIGSEKKSSSASVNVLGEELSYGRYVKFIPEYNCELSVTGRSSKTDGAWMILNTTTGDVVKTVSAGNTAQTATVQCEVGNTYYIESTKRNFVISVLSYTYDTPVVPSAEVTSFEKLNEETLKDENGGQADAYTFTVTGKKGKVSAKSIIFNIGDAPQTKDVSLTLDEGSTAVYGLIVNSKDSSEALPEVTQDMITIE